MLLQEPSESPYDLRFDLMGFHVRIAWTFWIGAVVFGWSLIDWMDYSWGAESPGKLGLLLLWALCLMVSITIHELGHALAFRQNGIDATIVIYHFGGLAIPRGSFGVSNSYGGLSEAQNLWIALAGPLAQISSAAVVIGIVKAMGFRVFAFALMPAGLDRVPQMLEGQAIENAGLFALVTFYIWPSVVWALLNLVPVWPLDGGRIMNSLVLMFGGRRDHALTVSLIAAGALAIYGFTNGRTFMGILFLSFALGNYQALQQNNTWRY